LLPSGTGQIGFINISGAASSKPEVEADIIENVATYGRQLGRMSDVLDAILSHLNARSWLGDAKKAVDAFEEMPISPPSKRDTWRRRRKMSTS